MRPTAAAILTAGLFLTSHPSMAQQSNSRVLQLEALKRIADLCNETKRCAGLIENVKIDLKGTKIDAIKVTTPAGTKFFFKRNVAHLGEICHCEDCVSETPLIWCEIVL